MDLIVASLCSENRLGVSLRIKAAVEDTKFREGSTVWGSV
jgi:hypothetical protein